MIISICRSALFVIVLSVMLGSAPAFAQLEPEVQAGSRIPVKPQSVEGEQLGRVVKGFARCVHQRNRDAAVRLLANSDPVSIDHENAGIEPTAFNKVFGMEACLGNQADYSQSALGLKFSPRTLRALMAEEVYLAKFARTPRLPEDAKEFHDRHYVTPEAGRDAAVGLGSFADCIVFNDVAGADAMLRTAPGTDAERQAARALAPALGNCLVEGQKVSLKPTNIREIVADGLWNRFGRVAAPAAASAR